MLSMTLRRLRVRPPRRGDGGYTVLEMAVVMTILMVVLAMFFSALTSMTNTSQRVQSVVTNEQSVRFTVDLMQRDLRGASTLVAQGIGAYGYQIRVTTGTPAQYVAWVYDTTVGSTTYKDLLRRTYDSTWTTVTGQTVETTNVENLASGTALFTYFDSHNNDLVSANPLTPANVANCAIRVHVQVDADSQPGPQPFSENVDVELRNRLPGGIIGCPS